MILVSKFHDYYDVVLRTAGRDTDVVFERLQSSVPLPEELEFPHYGERIYSERIYIRNESAYAVGAVLFCGTMYPYLEKRCRRENAPDTVDYAYGIEAVEAYFGPKSDVGRRKKRWGTSDYYEKHVLEPLRKIARRDYTELHRAHGTPLLHIHQEDTVDSYRMDRVLALNPCLRDLHFQRVVDTFSAYQRIYGFLSGVLTRPDREPRPITDKQRAVAHGFDAKTSFRIDAHPRKPRSRKTGTKADTVF